MEFPQRIRPFEHYAVKKTKWIEMGGKKDEGGVSIGGFDFADKDGSTYNANFKNWIEALIEQDYILSQKDPKHFSKWRFWTQNWCSNRHLSETANATCVKLSAYKCADETNDCRHKHTS